jgi:hypothetical protein
LAATRRGRVDLAVFPEGPERMAVVVEIKGTDWDAMRPERVRPNLRRHLRQLERYTDQFVARIRPGAPSVEDVGVPPSLVPPSTVTVDSVSPVLIYPRRPRAPQRAQLVERLVEEAAVQLVWYDETDWQQ